MGVAQAAKQQAASAQRHLLRAVRGRGEVAMLGAELEIDGSIMRYGVSDNADGAEQIWAINLHGFFCAGPMYYRESEHLAESLGWRLVNPSLPGFGGSDPLSWGALSLTSMARCIEVQMDHLGIERAILLGHSMGAATAIKFATAQPDRVLGIIYRDGAATPAWHHRHGILPRLFSPVAPDIGALADLGISVAADLPDLLAGRILSTLRSVLPDLRRNLKTLGRTAPVASMLMETDLTEEVEVLAAAGIPLLAEWGCFDRITTPETAEEFALAAGVSVLWVPGGHSWMLARPTGQADLLRLLPEGRHFLEQIRVRSLTAAGRPHLRALSSSGDHTLM